MAQVFGPEADEPAPGTSTLPSAKELTPLEISAINLAQLPPRRWIYYELLVRGYVTALAGPGGTGKTSIAMAVAMSIAGGRDLLRGEDAEDRVRRQGAVLYWNLEDPLDEMKLRVAAELKHRGLDQITLRDQFYLMSGRDHPLCVAQQAAQGQPQPTDLSAIVQMLRERRIVLLVIDPLVNAHALDGNSNSDLAIVIDQFRRIAHEADCAVLIVHHFRKGGQSGDVEASLGAVTLTNSCRVVETLTPMSETDAQALGIEASNRRRYVRRDNAKINLAAAPTQCAWYGFDSVSLGNGTEDYPDGDSIGVLSRWQPAPPMQGVTWDQIQDVLDAINIGLENGTEFYTNSAIAKERWAGNLLMKAMNVTREQAKLVLKQWLDDGVLLIAGYKSPALGGKDAKRLLVDPHARARLRQEIAARNPAAHV